MTEDRTTLEQEAAARLATPMSRRGALGKAAYVVPAVVALELARTEVALGKSGKKAKPPKRGGGGPKKPKKK